MPRKPGRRAAPPGLCYADPAWFEGERERILLSSWQPACHVSDLPGPGTAVRLDFAGRSALVMRGRDGELRAFVNACRHRGSRLIEGDEHTSLAYCVDSKLRCPYHGWTYDERGALVHVPGEERYAGLVPSQLGLQPLPTATALGFVFVAFEEPAQPLAEMLAPVVERVEARRFEPLRRTAEPRVRRYRADWKLVCEHCLDRWHLAAGSVPGGLGDQPGPEPRATDGSLCWAVGIGAGRGSGWSAQAYLRWLRRAGALPEDRPGAWSRCFLWPNVAIDVYPDVVRLMQVLPLGPGESALRETVLAQPDGSRDLRVARYLNSRVRRRTAAAERRLVEQRQLGLAAWNAAPGPLARDERGLRWFLDRVATAMRAVR